MYVDGCAVLSGSVKEGQGQLLRRAPGHVQYNFSQDILFEQHQKEQSEERDVRREEGFMPRGCILVTLHTN